MSEKPRVHLIIIDPQYDFCHPEGSLYVPGADKDMQRLAGLLLVFKDMITDITITLDTHTKWNIGHPVAWVDANGEHPKPFQQITSKDVESGRWRATIEDDQKCFLNHLYMLNIFGEDLTIWPPHCIYGTKGHSIYPNLQNAIGEWEKIDGHYPFFQFKGMNPYTEEFSAVNASLRTAGRPNVEFLGRFESKFSEHVWIAGEALSHCVRMTVEEAFHEMPNRNKLDYTIITDATSNVPSFDSLGDEFLKGMLRMGVNLKATDELMRLYGK